MTICLHIHICTLESSSTHSVARAKIWWHTLQFAFKSSGHSVMCSRMIWGKGMLEMEDVPVLEMNGTAYSI